MSNKERLFEVMSKLDRSFKGNLNENSNVISEKKLNENFDGNNEFKDNLKNFLQQNFGEVADEFNIEGAIYWYANDYHEGQNSDLYSILSTSEYKPSPLINNINDEDKVTQEMYSALVNEFESNNNVNESNGDVEYENVVFMQGDDAEEPLRILDEKGEDAALEYLKQWHNPGEHETMGKLGYGVNDNTYEKDGYIMSWNQPLGYIGIQYDTSNLNETSKSQVKSERASNFESLFRTLIKQYGYEPSQLDDMSDEEKRNFFDELDKKWVSDEEEKYLDDENGD